MTTGVATLYGRFETHRQGPAPSRAIDVTVAGASGGRAGTRERDGGVVGGALGDPGLGLPGGDGDGRADQGDETGLVLASPAGHRGEIGRVGLDEQLVERREAGG